MKKFYAKPELEMSLFKTENILTESGTGKTAVQKARAYFQANGGSAINDSNTVIVSW